MTEIGGFLFCYFKVAIVCWMTQIAQNVGITIIYMKIWWRGMLGRTYSRFVLLSAVWFTACRPGSESIQVDLRIQSRVDFAHLSYRFSWPVDYVSSRLETDLLFYFTASILSVKQKRSERYAIVVVNY